MYDEAVIVHVPRRRRYGAVVSLDTTAAAAASSFVEDCRSNLRTDERKAAGSDAGGSVSAD